MPGDDGRIPSSIDRLDVQLDLADLHSNRFGLDTVLTGLFPGKDKRATTSSSPLEARSESAIAINPLNELNMVGASKKFFDPDNYKFILAPIYTFDGGQTWHESTLPMHDDWNGMSDPTVAFDSFNHAFLVGEPIHYPTTPLHGLGMVVYRSSDCGVTWEQPIQLHLDSYDDKQWVQCDNNPDSPHYGNVYVAWAAHTALHFARSTDHGENWTGRGNDPPGATIAGTNAFAPDISISADGTLHMFWHMDGGSTIQYLRSTDGGASFEPLKEIVTGVHSLRGNLPISWGLSAF